ncbi:hypothetical protein GCM10009844_14370 [Nocardioides koreensis]|uniref:Uncharacterized protein n=1 Tax=Nocardioides koreensis TaxID=433651 RepID=A0ABN2ZIK8_9ACTN
MLGGIVAWLLAVLLAATGPVTGLSSTGPASPSETDSPLYTLAVDPPSASPAWQGFEPDADGTLVRISIHDGYDGPMLSLSTDGRVVVRGETSVLATRDDFVTWQVSDAALDRALRSLRRVGVLDAEPGAFGEGGVSQYTRSVGVFLGSGGGISGSEESPRFPRLWRAATRLADPASYGDGLVSGPEPWLPDEIALLFHRPDAANPYPMATWPFDEPIAQMAQPAPAGSMGELAVCLRGADAATLFASLPGGVVGVYRWSDGTAVWSARVDVTTPGYRLTGSGCDPA